MKKKKIIPSIFFLILCFLLSASLLAQSNPNVPKQLQNHITLQLENVPLNDVLTKIAEKGNFQLLYSETFIPTNRIVSVNFNDIPAADALQEVLAQTSTDYNVTGAGQIVLVPSEAKPAPQQETPKTGTIAGNISNSQTGEVLTGANVVLEGTTLGASTDEDGMYYIDNLAPGDYTVTVIYVGFGNQSQNIKVNAAEKVIVNFALQPSLMDLDAIVVTGSVSDRQKRAIANPITTISAMELKQMPIANIGDLFEGKVPGGYQLDFYFEDRITQRVALRGNQNQVPSRNEVKTYIDGVEVADYRNSPVATIDPNDIEKIDILRGPMASTLYGSGASGGVIQIFTKKGRSSGGTKIRFKNYLTATSTPYLDKTPIGQHYFLNLCGGIMGGGFNLGITRSIEESPFPNNGIKDEKWRLNGGANIITGPLHMDLKLSFGTNQYGSTLNPKNSILAKERGWENMFESWKQLKDNRRTTTSQLSSLNVRHVIMHNWYHNLTLGYNRSSYMMESLSPSLTWVYDPDSGWGQVEKYQYSNQAWNKISAKWFTNTKQTFGLFTADMTAGIDYTIQDVDAASTKTEIKPVDMAGSSTDNGAFSNYGYTNCGYFGETVVGFRNRLFFTLGLRVEDNSYYGDEYGLDKSPRVGISYVHEFGKFLVKPRVSWGSSTRAPKVGEKTYQDKPYWTIIANPDLGPESQTGYEVGADIYYGDMLSFEVTYYDQFFKNGITKFLVSDPNDDWSVYQYQNLDEFFNKGWEFAGKLLLNPFTVNFTYTINDSKYGENTLSDSWMYKKGAKKLYTPYQTGYLGLAYQIPALYSGSSKGGFVGLGLTYRGKMLAVNQLRQYDGIFNPDIDRITPADKEYITEMEGFFKLRFRANYWITDYLSLFMDVNNLTDYQKSSISELVPTLGRVSKVGLDIQL